MATIHRTTMVPTKVELMADWLPRQPWYRDPGAAPELTRAGGFRLDDPEGEVGIEFIVVIDGTAEARTTYFVPLSYRAAPLAGADEGLLGTSEHGVLGLRWLYDAAHDPVAVDALLDFLSGRTVAQQQNVSDTPDPSVTRSWTAAGRPAAPRPLRVSDVASGRTAVAVELSDDPAPHVLEIVRVLSDPAGDEPVIGAVEADWQELDGATARGRVVVVR